MVVNQADCSSLSGGQRVQRRLDCESRLLGRQKQAGPPGSRLIFEVIACRLSTFPQTIDGSVVGDGVKPRCELGRGLIAPRVLPCAKESLLGHFFCLFFGAEQAKRVSDDAA